MTKVTDELGMHIQNSVLIQRTWMKACISNANCLYNSQHIAYIKTRLCKCMLNSALSHLLPYFYTRNEFKTKIILLSRIWSIQCWWIKFSSFIISYLRVYLYLKTVTKAYDPNCFLLAMKHDESSVIFIQYYCNYYFK